MNGRRASISEPKANDERKCLLLILCNLRVVINGKVFKVIELFNFMVDPKVLKICNEFRESFLSRLSGEPATDLGKKTDKVIHVFENPCSEDMMEGVFPPVNTKQESLVNQALQMLYFFGQYKIGRINRRVHEANRLLATEDQSYMGLRNVIELLDRFVIPYRVESEISNSVMKELYNLALANVFSITQAAASEYIPEDKVYAAKMQSVHLCKLAFRAKEIFRKRGVTGELGPFVKDSLDNLLAQEREFFRPFELTFVVPKKVYKKDELTERLAGEVLDDFSPDFVVPIAQGGIESAIIYNIAYEDKGKRVITYPLMFSIKTRNQKEPWIYHDTKFFRMVPQKSVLVTEDWITTGNTARGILNSLESHFPSEVRIATLKRDPQSYDVPILNKYRIYTGQEAHYAGPKTDEVLPSNGEQQ